MLFSDCKVDPLRSGYSGCRFGASSDCKLITLEACFASIKTNNNYPFCATMIVITNNLLVIAYDKFL